MLRLFNKKYFFSVLVILILFGTTAIVHAQYGLDRTAQKSGLDQYSGSVETVAGNIVSQALGVVGILFLGMMIYGGMIWMFARGNEEMAKRALDTVITSIIGLIVISASYAITTFVLQATSTQQGGGGGPSNSGYCLTRGPLPNSCRINEDCAGERGEVCHQILGGICLTIVQQVQADPCTADSQCSSGFYCYIR